MKSSLISRAIQVCFFIAVQHLGAQQSSNELDREALRREGYKIQLSDFATPVPKEFADRARELIPANMHIVGQSRLIPFLDDSDLMRPVGKSAAEVLWMQEHLANPSGFVQYSYAYGTNSTQDVWPILHDSLDEVHSELDTDESLLLSGPFQFDLDFTKGGGLLLPHLAGLRRLALMFSERTVVALHENDSKQAWTNLLAATRLVTGWRIEPVEVSQYVRCDCLETVYKATWQALQADGWSETNLGKLKQEWESLDLFKSVPDAIANIGLSDCALYQFEKQRKASSYNDETAEALLRFAVDRQVEARRAVEASSWMQMRGLPGVMNQPSFNFPKNSIGQTSFAQQSRRMPLAFASKGLGLFARVAEAETLRRLIITAISIKHYDVLHGEYPKGLPELESEFLKPIPTDFMDGKPLRYHRTEGGHFLLYSVGLNCRDDGGEMSAERDRTTYAPPMMRQTFVVQEGDLVWPEAASKTVAGKFEEAREQEKERKEAEVAARLTKAEAYREAAHRRIVKELLSNKKFEKTTWTFPKDTQNTQLAYHGRPLTEVLPNTNSLGNRHPSLDELFTLRQVITGKEPEIITYELPMSYDAMTNMRASSLVLLMDCDPGNSFLNEPTLSKVRRATNGNCLLAWNTAFEKPGQHVLQALLFVPLQPWYKEIDVKGPVQPFFSTNLFHFFVSDSMYDESGVYLNAEVCQSNAVYSIQIKSPSDKPLKTITGSTTNAMIETEWDLIDQRGQKYEGTEFKADFTITLPKSNLTQTLRHSYAKLAPRKQPPR